MLFSSPLRSEKRLAKEMESNFRFLLVEEPVEVSNNTESSGAGSGGGGGSGGSQSGKDEGEAGENQSEPMEEEGSQSGKTEEGGGKNASGDQAAVWSRLFQARPVKVIISIFEFGALDILFACEEQVGLDDIRFFFLVEVKPASVLNRRK